MRNLFIAAAAALAACAPSASSDFAAQYGRSSGELDWVAGYWLSCDGTGQTAEVWIGAGSGLLVGATHATGPEGPSFEHARMGRLEDGRIAFFASPGGAQAVAFPLVSMQARRATFENPDHDFPQRVIYTREGNTLIGRIEGEVQGKPQSMEWRYERAQLGERCKA
jgi:hypothetical protein